MKISVQHPVYGEIVYNEGFWSGKKTLQVNGVEAKAISKKEYMIDDKKATVKGSFFTGASLLIEGEAIQLSPKAKWYEIVLAILPFLFLVTWGNNVSLCQIFPVIGGAIGGALGGVSAVTALLLMKNHRSPLFKILIEIIVAAVTIFIAFALAMAFILMSI